MTPTCLRATSRRRSRASRRRTTSSTGRSTSDAASSPDAVRAQAAGVPGLAASELAARMDGVEVLVVQGAPVTDAVLDASGALRLVCCARGGPVNVDVEAVTARGLPLVNTPGQERRGGRRPDARVPGHARARPARGAALPRGRRPAARQLGGRAVHRQRPAPARARARRLRPGRPPGGAAGAARSGCSVLAYDPYVRAVDGRRRAGRRRSTSCSRAPTSSRCTRARRAENDDLIDAAALATDEARARSWSTPRARRSSTSRRSTPRSPPGHLAGAALDVVEHGDGDGRHRLLRHENVVLTPAHRRRHARDARCRAPR